MDSIKISGLPHHILKLKAGAVIMLMHSLNTSQGLINGTQMQVMLMNNYSIDCKVLTGTSFGEIIMISCLKLAPSENLLSFKLQCNQFPLQLAYAMTISKSQGQSLNKVVIYLP